MGRGGRGVGRVSHGQRGWRGRARLFVCVATFYGVLAFRRVDLAGIAREGEPLLGCVLDAYVVHLETAFRAVRAASALCNRSSARLQS